MSARKITIAGFLNELKRRHETMVDRPFCWILGSGASVQSGIPTGGVMAKQWLAELHELEDFDKRPIEKWATEENLGIPGFDYADAARFYPWIYLRRYRDYRDQGYAFLENAMDHAEPSFGYSVLAQIMANTRHKVAVTTNFDNLVPDALGIYTEVSPLVCGHESLTGYIRPNLRRPLVAKIHRDLLLKPLNEPGEIEKLPGEWEAALQTIFDNFTPILIGYGGNDGSLMGFLERIKPIIGGIFWCFRGTEPEERVQKVIEHHRGRLVPIAGFDELMLQIWEKLQLADPRPTLEQTHRDRVASWQTQFEKLNASLAAPAENDAAESARELARKAAAAAVERLTKEKDWWAWQLKADAEGDPAKREMIFREGLQDFPDSAGLTGNFAIFMKNIRQGYEEAEQLYRRAILLDPKHAINTANFALFMEKIRKEPDEAERLYRRAMELDPKDADIAGKFALFMKNMRSEYDEAERLYRTAVELDPNDSTNIGNFANFLTDVRKDHAEAERLYRMALALNPKDAHITANFASFMADVHKDYAEADRLYRVALELDPNNDRIKKQYAAFLKKRPETS